MKTLPEQFLNHIAEEALFHHHDGLLLAVSGGVDSVVLAELCHRSGFRFAIAHANFQLRGEESERDEAFVTQLAQRYRVPFFTRRFDTEAYATQHRQSVQEAARDLRYQWFRELLQENPTWNYVATAHHADDQIETVVMNFFRGTGIAGLRGILPRQQQLVRPLLAFHKAALLQFASGEGLHWVEDRSNATEKYTRNYFRLTILPLIEKVYPAAAVNILGNAHRFRDMEVLYQQSMEHFRRQLLFPRGVEVHIPVEKLRKAHPLHTILFELLKGYGFTAPQLPDLIHLLDAETGKYVASGSHRVIKNRNWIVVAPLATPEVHHMLVEKIPQTVRTRDFEVSFKEIPVPGDLTQTDPHVAHIDAGLLQFPLLLRAWRAGDYFYPLGLKKKKKLSRFLIDQKLSRTEKEKVWVLLSGSRVVWVVGHRIDDRYKITPSTSSVVKVVMSNQ